MKSIFEYDNYRQFLADFYNEKKAQNPNFSYRYIAQRVGFKSAGHFTKILQDKANISINLIERFAEFLKLKKREEEYFRELVLFDQARNHKDKKRHFEKMITFKESSVRVLNADQYEYYDKWYYTAIRQILEFYPFDGNNYAELGKMMTPSISADEAQKAIELLVKLGLVKRDENGFYKQVDDAAISTGYGAKSVAINNFVINAMRLAEQTMNRGEEDFNLSWATVAVSNQGFETIQNELRAFRRRILEIAKNDEDPDRVHHFNFQVFPLTKRHRRKKES